DGGIADTTPVSHAVALGARRIYVLPTQNPGDRGLPRPPRSALAAASTIASTRLATRTDTTSSPDRTGHCRRAIPLSVRWMSPCLVTGRVVVPEPADLLRDAGSRHAWPACPLVAPVARRVSPAPRPWRCPIFARACRSARWPGRPPR